MRVDQMATHLGDQQRARRLGAACVVSGLLGVLIAVLTVSYPDAVAEERWSYPFPFGVALVVGILLAVTHALTLAGFVGVRVADPHRGSRAAAIGLAVAVAGYALLVLCELASGVIGNQSTSSAAAALVGAAFGVASLLTAVGSVVAGTVIVRAGSWTGLGRWMILASGVIMLALVTPANVVGDPLLRMVALSLWSLTFVPLGRAVAGGRSGDVPA